MFADIFLVIAAAVLVGVYVSWRAGRLDRLHARVEAARAALDAALLRRNCVAVELASSGLLDPATSVLLAEAAHDARTGTRPRELAESDLSRALRAAFGQPGFRRCRGTADRAGGRGPPGLSGQEVLQRRGGRYQRGTAADSGQGTAAVRPRGGPGVLRHRRFAGGRRRGRRRRHAPPDGVIAPPVRWGIRASSQVHS